MTSILTESLVRILFFFATQFAATHFSFYSYLLCGLLDPSTQFHSLNHSDQQMSGLTFTLKRKNANKTILYINNPYMHSVFIVFFFYLFQSKDIRVQWIHIWTASLFLAPWIHTFIYERHTKYISAFVAEYQVNNSYLLDFLPLAEHKKKRKFLSSCS